MYGLWSGYANFDKKRQILLQNYFFCKQKNHKMSLLKVQNLSYGL